MAAGTRTDRQPAYVLHRRPYRESSLLVDLLTRDHGRVGVVARAARGARGGLSGVLQPCQGLLVGWTGRGELKTLVAAERAGPGVPVAGERLYSLLYVNEVLVRALAPLDPHAALFDAYACLLPALAGADDAEPPLRGFELLLLAELGYAFEPGVDAASGELVEPQGRYRFDPSVGLCAAPDAGPEQAYPGWALQAIARRDFADPDTRRHAKRLMREALAGAVGERPLRARDYFRRRGAKLS